MNRSTTLKLKKLELKDSRFYFRLTGNPEVMRLITGNSLSQEESISEVSRLVETFKDDPVLGVWVARVRHRDRRTIDRIRKASPLCIESPC